MSTTTLISQQSADQFRQIPHEPNETPCLKQACRVFQIGQQTAAQFLSFRRWVVSNTNLPTIEEIEAEFSGSLEMVET